MPDIPTRIANYYTRRWATTPDPQASLFEKDRPMITPDRLAARLDGGNERRRLPTTPEPTTAALDREEITDAEAREEWLAAEEEALREAEEETNPCDITTRPRKDRPMITPEERAELRALAGCHEWDPEEGWCCRDVPYAAGAALPGLLDALDAAEETNRQHLLREDLLRGQVADLEAERDALLDTIERVRALHQGRVVTGPRADLRKRAERATPGPWVQGDPAFGPGNARAVVSISSEAMGRDVMGANLRPHLLDLEFIAAANPAVVLALLDALDAAEAELDGLAAAIEQVRALAAAWRYDGRYGWGPWQAGEGPDPEGETLDFAALELVRVLDGSE